MTLAITHTKTDNIADWTQTDLDAQIAAGNFPAGTVLADIVLPSDWNDTHTLTGLVSDAQLGTGINANKLANGSVSNTEFQYLDGVTSGIQTQIDGKQATGNYITALTGEVTASGPGSVAATVTNSAVIGKVLTGFSALAGVVAATDTILQAINKIVGNIASVVSGYVPYTGGTSNVDLGAHNLTVDTTTLFVDATNHRVGVGTLSPATTFQVDSATTNGSRFGDGTRWGSIGANGNAVWFGSSSASLPIAIGYGNSCMAVYPSTGIHLAKSYPWTDPGAGAVYVGSATGGGNTQQLSLGHNGTTNSSSNGVAQIRFNSQFDNYPFTMGAEGNGYNFYVRQTNGGQGTFAFNFGTISTVAYQNEYQYVTDHYENILTGKWLTSVSGAGTNYYGVNNTIYSDSTGTLYDTYRIQRAINGGYYPQTNDPLLSLFNGSSTASITATNRYVARFNRQGFLGIGTTNTYAAPTTMQQAALTIDMGSKTGVQTADGTTALQVKTVGSSTSVVCVGNGNGENALGIQVGTKITANSLTRTVVSLTSAQGFVVDSAVDWSNGGSGYNFTYTNPYISLQDGATKYVYVGPTGQVALGTSTPDASAKLQTDSTTQGFLPPRMTTTQRNAISSPAQGLMLFDTTTATMWVYNGTSWLEQ